MIIWQKKDNKMIYPIQRNLDGVYFRIKRNDEYVNVCFSDLTEEEKDSIMEKRDVEWLKSLCKILGETLYKIGDFLDLYGE